MEKVESFIENFDKTLEVQFRAQAEMLDERFVQVFTVMDRHVTLIRGDIGALQKDTSALQKDIAMLREGMKILLERSR